MGESAASGVSGEKIWLDGAFVDWSEARIHVLTHTLHYGLGVFEGIRCYKTDDERSAVFRLADHIRRLFDSARINLMAIPFERAQLEAAVLGALRANHLEEGYVRPIAFYGCGTLGLDPSDLPVHIAIAAVSWGSLHGKGAVEDGIEACVSSWQRLAPNTLPTIAKAGGHYLSSQLIHMEARRNGFDEGIGLGADGMVSEGSGQNLFVVRDGVIRTPPTDGSMLLGITRDSVMQLLRDAEFEVVEGPIPREMLYTKEVAHLLPSGVGKEKKRNELLYMRKRDFSGMVLRKIADKAFLKYIKSKKLSEGVLDNSLLMQ